MGSYIWHATPSSKQPSCWLRCDCHISMLARIAWTIVMLLSQWWCSVSDSLETRDKLHKCINRLWDIGTLSMVSRIGSQVYASLHYNLHFPYTHSAFFRKTMSISPPDDVNMQVCVAIGNRLSGFDIYSLTSGQPLASFRDKNIATPQDFLPVLYIHGGHCLLGGCFFGKAYIWNSEIGSRRSGSVLEILSHQGLVVFRFPVQITFVDLPTVSSHRWSAHNKPRCEHYSCFRFDQSWLGCLLVYLGLLWLPERPVFYCNSAAEWEGAHYFYLEDTRSRQIFIC